MNASRILLTTAIAFMLAASLRAEEELMPGPIIPAPSAPKAQPRTIDLAVCLDVSGSMRGLVDSARTRIWAIVNDLALAKPTPRLRVALLSFGHDSYPKEKGWVRVEADLTEDLDLISQKLFALTLNGGTELVGRVMQTGLDELSWNKRADTLRIMVVAGNESADQDKEVNFRDVAKRCIERGIMVNSIYCGNPADKIAPGWKEVALLADGHFATIDQNRGALAIATPFDKQIADLSTALNTTYIPFGADGKRGYANQQLQDTRASSLNGQASAGRALSKSGKLYRCSWCLVDSYRNKQVDLTKIKQEDLPEELKGKSAEEIKLVLDKKFEERKKIQLQVGQVNAKRSVWVAKELAESGKSKDKAFDEAIRSAIRSQAAQKGYSFPKETK